MSGIPRTLRSFAPNGDEVSGYYEYRVDPKMPLVEWGTTPREKCERKRRFFTEWAILVLLSIQKYRKNAVRRLRNL